MGVIMYARVTSLSLKKGTTDEAVGIFHGSIVPAAKEQAGFRGAYFLTDSASDKCVALTFWESADAATANEENRYYQEQLVKLMKLFVEPPIREGYEVAVESR